MKKRYALPLLLFKGLQLLNLAACKTNEDEGNPINAKPEPKPELTMKEQILDYANNVCIPQHTSDHSYAAMNLIRYSPHGINMPSYGLSASPERCIEENYVGSDLYTHLLAMNHSDCIIIYSNSFEKSYTMDAELLHNENNNNKLKTFVISNIDVKDEYVSPVFHSTDFKSFNPAVPSSGTYTTTFNVSR